MKHDCRLKNIDVFEDEHGRLFIKVHLGMLFGKFDTFPVEYCPVCGNKGGKSHIENIKLYDRYCSSNPEEPINIYGSITDECVQQLNNSIKDFNLECIREFMNSQNLQNSLFLDVQISQKERIMNIEEKYLLLIEKLQNLGLIDENE